MRYFTIIFFLFIFVFNEDVGTLNAIEIIGPYKIIGLFSSCLHHGSSKQTQHELKSSTIQKLSRTLFVSDCIAPNTCSNERNFTDLYHYEEYDVCHDFDHLLKILIKFKIGDGYYLASPDNDTKEEGNIVMVITYLDQHFVDMVFCLLFKRSAKDPELLLLRDQITPSYEFLRGSFPHKGIAYQQLETLSSNLLRIGWKNVAVVLIKIGTKVEIDLYTELFHSILDGIKAHGDICYMTDVVENEEQLASTISKLRYVDYRTPILLYGSEESQLKIFKQTEGNLLYNRKWGLNDITSDFHFLNGYSKVGESSVILIHRRPLFTWAKLLVVENSSYYPKWSDFTSPDKCDTECRNLYRKCLELFVGIQSKLNQYKKGLVKRNVKSFVKYYNKGIFNVLDGHSLMISRILHVEMSDYKPLLQSKECLQPICRPGLYKNFGERKDHWNYSYGWRCTQCPINTIKPAQGDGSCIPCSSYYTSNKDKTICYDPYRKIYFSFQTISVKLCVAVSSFLCVSTMLTFLVFMVNKQTWIVQSTDLKISTAHLALLMVNFVLPNISFLMDSSWIYWTVYLLSMSLVNCCCLSIVLVKSKKLLQAFNSKVLVNKNEAKRTTYHQITIVILNLMLSTAIFICSIKMKELKEKSIRNQSTLESVEYCEHGVHICLQIVFLICLQIACFIPAYQGRNLPSVFNNAMAILYGSFVMVVSSLVFFPIYLFQVDPRQKYIVEHLIFQCLGLIQVGFMYWPKVFILLFQPQKKTKHYLRKKTFKSSVSKANGVCR